MKRQLTIDLDEALALEVERFALSSGLSLASLIETSLRKTLGNDAAKRLHPLAPTFPPGPT